METVTVRMARGDRTTSWGFGVTEALNKDVIIVNVVSGSLADRAGLRNGDILDELEGLNNLDINAVDRLLVTSRDKIEIVVHRNASGQARIWRPDITENSTMNRYSGHGPSAEERPYRVSLEHSNDSRPPQSFNSSALPFNADPRVKHLQYNSPIGLYSNANVAEQYAQQTAGIVNNSNANAVRQSFEQPVYLRSETLRLLKEEERNPRGTLSTHPNPSGLPSCFVCGRPILGVMARAAGHDLHGDCLSCSTCGNSLRNVGHHFIDEKFYCDVHGRQKKGIAPIGLDPTIAVKSSPTAAHPIRPQENVRAFYQPDILSRRPLSVSPTPGETKIHIHHGTPKTQGTISPSNRGIPSSVNYGVDRQSVQSTPITRPVNIQTQLSPNPPPVPANPPPGQSYLHSSSERLEKKEQDSGGRLNDTRGQGSLTNPGGRIPYCEACKQQIRGAFVLATGLAWCPEHFVCANKQCGRRLLECGFVEENGSKYCENCFEAHIAPRCAKCAKPIISDCLNALQKKWHPTCFTCAHCQKPFGNSAFYLEQNLPYCEHDWNTLFTTKCVNCRFPIEAGDRWVEALGSAFHSNCFNCTRCHANLEGESFFAKNGQPFCKMHA